MATITVDVPNAIAPDVVAALVYMHPEVDVTGLTQQQTANRIVRHMIRNDHKAWKLATAMQQITTDFNDAKAAAEAAADAESLTIT